jgi:BON domain-containing protein
MKYRICCILLLLAGMGFAQQQGQPPPTTSPPYQTPPTFPEGRQTPRAQMPPDTEAPPPQTMSTQQVEQQITQRFSSEPELSKSNIDAKVDDNSVVLTGSVDTEVQHDLALRIARSYAGDRRIVDKVKVKQQT